MSSDSNRKPHVVVFPIPLQGHINPMMLLAQHLNSSGIRVTFLLPERALSTLHTTHNTFHNNGHTARIQALHEDPRHQLHRVHPCCNIACHAEADMHNSITNKKNGAVEIDDNIHNAKSKPKKGGENDDSRKGADKPNMEAHKSYHTNLHHNADANDDDNDVDDDGNDGDGADNDGHVHHVRNDDFFWPPIQFEMLPDAPSSDNQTMPTTSSYVLVFLHAMPLLMRRLEELLDTMKQQGQPATCIISDSFVPWTQDVADKFGIPRMEFWSSSVKVYSMGYHIPELIDKGYLPAHPGDDQESCIDIIPGLAPFRLADFFYDLHPLAISSPVFELICKAFSRARESQRVLVNSFFHLEKDITEALRAEGVSIYPVGPLLPLQMCMSCDRRHRICTEEPMEMWSTSLYADDEESLAWLDLQAESSVIYVSFGSMASLSKREIEELILGLEGSEQPYLLVIRPDMVPGVCVQTMRRGRGRICEWVPQIHVLGHPAIGAFLTHCGWNSIMEGMCMGVPMIGCPRESEQYTSMKFLRDEWKVAIGLSDQQGEDELQSGQTRAGSANKVQIKKERVEGAIRALMQEEDGKLVRERMKDLQEAAKGAAADCKLGCCSLQMLIHDIRNDVHATPH